MRDLNVTIETVPRPSFDGGRDALCKDRAGPIADQILLDFVLEAKCYAWATESVSRNFRASAVRSRQTAHWRWQPRRDPLAPHRRRSVSDLDAELRLA